jgi:predicted Zn-dependent peptidase
MPDIVSPRLGEKYSRIEHSSGLRILLNPMPDFSVAYAIFAARVGSIDDGFSLDGGAFERVPMGIAHFLEHKLFESEQGDAFEQYAKTGAWANAYTSFDKTAYLFSCTDNFAESLDVLLNLVTNPYFTKETVAKEQGIIGQEIRMYEDDPGWRVMFNLLGALFHNHPIKNDIAGTVESIAEIDAETLYKCYRAFYNPGNMVLAVAGNFDVAQVLRACDGLKFPVLASAVTSERPCEPPETVVSRTSQTLQVSTQLFEIGFKANPKSYADNILAQVAGSVVCDILAGESTALYREMYDEGLINSSFSSEILAGPDYLVVLFSGESENPERVFELLKERVEYLKRCRIDAQDFERAKRAAYGGFVGMYAGAESMANLMVLTEFAGLNAYMPLECLAKLTPDDAQEFLSEHMSGERAALSVIMTPDLKA